MGHGQLQWGEINGKPFTLYYDYDQIWDGKLTQLNTDEKIEWFRLRMDFVFLEPLRRLYAGKSGAYRELNSTKAGDTPPRSFVIPTFSLLLNGIEALGSLITPPHSKKRANFHAFIEAYMKAWDVRVPQSPYSTDSLKEILWKHFRNGIAHGFCIGGGGIDNEANAAPGWRVVNGRFQIGPSRFFKDFTPGVNAFFQDPATVQSDQLPSTFSGSLSELRPLNLDAWFDEPYYKTAKGSFSTKGAFILRKLLRHDGARFVEVMADLYRDDVPDPQDITKFEWQTILAYMGATEAEIADVQKRMGRVWR